MDRICVLKEFVDYLPESGAKVSCYLHIANIYFRNGKDAIKEREYNGCLRYMDDCAATLKEARKSCSDLESGCEVNITDLEKDIHHQKDVVQKCLAKVKEAQERQTQGKEEAKERENAKIQLKSDLKKLEGFKKLTLDKFIERVYKQWPPKGVDKSKLRSPSSASSKSSTRRLLIHAIAFYHPDKVDKKKHGVKWHVLCDEITKCLNALLSDVNT
nr:uncharacterized protein LOC129278874 [Lytechinus pictus]